MIPRIFNDCAYYAQMTGKIYQLNPKIQVYYWDCYDRVADVKTVKEQGHELINANKELYFVVADDPWISVTKEDADNFDKYVFVGDERVEKSLGYMMSIWCDDGRDETMTAEQIVEETTSIMRHLK